MNRVSLAAFFLCFAWLCASLPRFEAGTIERSRPGDGALSHRAGLVSEVHRVLAQLQGAATEASAVTAEEHTSEPDQPAVPAGNTAGKRIDLALAKAFVVLGPTSVHWDWSHVVARAAGRTEDVPVPPPRFVV